MVDKIAARNNVLKWLKDTKLKKGEEFAIFTTDNMLKIEICDTKGSYRDDKGI